jgi:hypothetical protein
MPQWNYGERCRIPPYLPKYEPNSCRISKFIGYITSPPIKTRHFHADCPQPGSPFHHTCSTARYYYPFHVSFLS